MFQSAEEIIDAMSVLENPEQRKVLMGFFKCGKGQYGEGDAFLGLKVPETRAFVKEARTLPLSEVQKLLYSQWHEVRLCGFLILVAQFEQLAKKETAEAMNKRDSLVDFYLKNARQANNWDLVDLSCYKILGRWLMLPSCKTQSEKLTIMDTLAESSNLWEQRISMVSTMWPLKEGETFYTLRYATQHLHHPHDLMRKAVGWLLREMGKRCGMDVLRDFLSLHHDEMARVSLSYAIERMDEKERKRWMQRAVD